MNQRNRYERIPPAAAGQGVADAVGFVGGALLGFWLGQLLGVDMFAPGYGTASMAWHRALVGLGGGLGLHAARRWRAAKTKGSSQPRSRAMSFCRTRHAARPRRAPGAAGAGARGRPARRRRRRRTVEAAHHLGARAADTANTSTTRCHARRRQPLCLCRADDTTGTVLGTTSYHDILPAVKRVEIGYTWYRKACSAATSTPPPSC
jgi:predicted lipid-binding transport protein (Tim44 family)